MKRLIGVSLLLLILILSGCGGSSPSANRITVLGTINGTAGTPLVSGDFHGGTITITALTPGTLGLGPISDVNPVTVGADGTFLLRNVPVDHQVVLKIAYNGSTPTDTFYAWYVLDTTTDAASITLTINPNDLAAGRLTFDLVRSYTDFRLALDMFGTDYTAIRDHILTLVGSPSLVDWMGTPSSFYTFLQGKITDSTNTTEIVSILNKSYGATAVGGDKRITLTRVTATPDMSSGYVAFSEDAGDKSEDPLTSLDNYLVADLNACNIITVQAVEVDTTSDNIIVRVQAMGPASLASSTLVLVVGSATTLTKTSYTMVYESKSHDLYNFTCTVPVSALPDTTGYNLFQVIYSSDALTWYNANYEAIDYDRTPTFFMTIPAKPIP